MNERIQKPWGYFEVILSSEKITVKRIRINAEQRMSLQSHLVRDEFWYSITGSGEFEIGDNMYHVNDVERFEMFEIPKGTRHRARANTFEGLTFIEISIGEFYEDDIIRYEDYYGRME